MYSKILTKLLVSPLRIMKNNFQVEGLSDHGQPDSAHVYMGVRPTAFTGVNARHKAAFKH